MASRGVLAIKTRRAPPDRSGAHAGGWVERARTACIAALLGSGCLAVAGATETLAGYSPNASARYPTRVFFGDTHLHTSNSADAVAWGARLGPEDAYRFARGETVTASGGEKARLSRPLDFLVIADHSESFGLLREAIEGNYLLMLAPRARDARATYGTVTDESRDAFSKIIQANSDKSAQPADGWLVRVVGQYVMDGVWRRYVATADAYNEPGRFTTLIGYEWTSGPGGDNLHRVVVLRDGADRAGQVRPFSSDDSEDPEDLWAALEAYEKTTGGRALAIPHNGNLSNGRMFAPATLFGAALTPDYAKRRARWEPLLEATQIKGDGETHPFLSPNDEFADYETWARTNLTMSAPKRPDMLEFEYARSALKNGLALEAALGTNPFRYGMIGSSDSHTGLATVEEDDFFGKHTGLEPTPARASRQLWKFDDEIVMSWEQASSGYAAVWADENTREALFDAMERKEVYATTGPRMTVRFFGGWSFGPSDALQHSIAQVGYARGVPMGGSLAARPPDTSPTFLVAALRDPIGANLDRIQIVKGWLGVDGKTHERVYDVAWSDPGLREPDPRTGKLPPVGDTVDVREATWKNSIGAPELATVWTDPDFDPAERAFYYVRVIEIPTPRWTAYDAKRYGITLPPQVQTVTQERAYTSPIWYTP
jgi:hypothetical protein